MQAYNPSEEVELRLYRAMVQDREDGSYQVTLNTSRGPILGIFHLHLVAGTFLLSLSTLYSFA